MIDKDQLKLLLIEQKENMQKQDTGIPREALDTFKKKVKLPQVIVITGLRRSGKSTFLRQIMEKYYDNDYYYFNFEDERLYNFEAKNFNIIYETLLELFGEYKTFFIDEIQNIRNFETFVRRFYDQGFKFYITGSNAKLLSKELGTKLTGRHLDITLNPFSFKEYLLSKQFKIKKETLLTTKSRAEIKKHFNIYLKHGGMPEYVIYKDPDILKTVYEDIIIKDIFVRYNIDDVKLLRELYQYLINTFSQKFSYHSLTRFINLSSSNTIKKYISYLEETHFAILVSKFDFSMKKQIINDKKLYIIDNAFIPLISTRVTKDKGWFLENLVCNNLKILGNIFYFSEKNECDFIIEKNSAIISAIQVCWNISQTNKERELNGLLEAMKKYNLDTGLILTYDNEEILKKGKKVIKVMPVWKWLIKKVNLSK